VACAPRDAVVPRVRDPWRRRNAQASAGPGPRQGRRCKPDRDGASAAANAKSPRPHRHQQVRRESPAYRPPEGRRPETKRCRSAHPVPWGHRPGTGPSPRRPEVAGPAHRLIRIKPRGAGRSPAAIRTKLVAPLPVVQHRPPATWRLRPRSAPRISLGRVPHPWKFSGAAAVEIPMILGLGFREIGK